VRPEAKSQKAIFLSKKGTGNCTSADDEDCIRVGKRAAQEKTATEGRGRLRKAIKRNQRNKTFSQI